MIVIMRNGATQQDINAILERLKDYKLSGRIIVGEERSIIGIVGADIPPTLAEELDRYNGVQSTARISRPYKQAAREFPPPNTVVDGSGSQVGGSQPVAIAGPCAVER